MLIELNENFILGISDSILNVKASEALLRSNFPKFFKLSFNLVSIDFVSVSQCGRK